MTIDVESPIERYSYTGPGRYDFNFHVFIEDNVSVVHTNTNGEATYLTKDVDYTVTLDPSTEPYLYTGYIQTVAPTEVSGILDIRRTITLEQMVDWVNQGRINLETLEASFDRIYMVLQGMDVTINQGAQATSWRGPWAPATEYFAQDVVTAPNNSIYVCLIPHISTNDFDADLAAGNWQLAIDVEDIERLHQEITEMYNRIAEWYATIADWYSDIQTWHAEIMAAETQVILYAEYAANCAQAAYDAAQSVTLPDPTSGNPGDAIVVDPAGTGWELKAISGVSGGLVWQVWDEVTPVAQGNGYAINTAAASKVVTLPDTPNEGQIIGFLDLNSTFGTNVLTITPGAGQSIMGFAESMTVSRDNSAVVLTFFAAENDWRVTSVTPQGESVAPGAALSHVQITIDAADVAAGAPLFIGVGPNGMNVQTTQVEIVTPFDGGAGMTIGTDADPDLLLADAFIDEAVAGAYGKPNNLAYAGAPDFKVFPSGSPTVGEARVTIYFN